MMSHRSQSIALVSYGFLPEAEIEYLQAVKFNEGRRPGLGARLIKEFERTIRFAVERPLTWKVVHASGIRRIDLARFPYAIVFRLIPAGGLQVT
jgi:toxin ParE1/3/4